MLAVSGLRKTYGAGDHATPAIADLSFEIGRNEFVCIVGPSGCGKTTLLKIMAGLLSPTAGSVKLDGSPVDSPPEQMALVFQDYSRSLYPWMRVRDNVNFPLRRKRLPKVEATRIVDNALASVGLTEFADHYPWQLSGGMQQRVAIARGLAYQPEILLMDEPFGALDAQTRQELEDTLLKIRDEYGITIVFVTHDIDESVYLGDRVLVLSNRPTVMDTELVIDLPAPRDQISTKELPEFVRLRAEVYSRIRRSKQASSARTDATAAPLDAVVGTDVEAGAVR